MIENVLCPEFIIPHIFFGGVIPDGIASGASFIKVLETCDPIIITLNHPIYMAPVRRIST
jgi:hypothetical protein